MDIETIGIGAIIGSVLVVGTNLFIDQFAFSKIGIEPLNILDKLK